MLNETEAVCLLLVTVVAFLSYLIGYFLALRGKKFTLPVTVSVVEGDAGHVTQSVLLKDGDSISLGNSPEVKDSYAVLELKDLRLFVTIIPNMRVETTAGGIALPNDQNPKGTGGDGKTRKLYRYKVHNPRDPLSDSDGYVRLRNKVAYDYYVKRLEGLRKRRNAIPSMAGTLDDKRRLRIAILDEMENIPHGYGRKEYKGTKKR